jgi:hypothetical protein
MAGSLTHPWWRSDRQEQFWPPDIPFFNEQFSKEFNNSNLYGPRRRMVVLTQNSHKNKELQQSGNYGLVKVHQLLLKA